MLLSSYLRTQASLAKAFRVEGGISLGILGFGVLGTLVPAANTQVDPSTRTLLRTEGIVGGTLLAILGLATGLLPSDGERLYRDWLAADLNTPLGRTAAVLGTELKFEAAAKRGTAARRTGAVLGIIVGGLGGLLDAAVAGAVSLQGKSAGPAVYVLAGLSAYVVVSSLFQWIVFRTPLERAWEDYSHDPLNRNSAGTPPAVSVPAQP